MDFIKISIWLFLAMSSVYKSECKSFRKYLVPNTSRASNEDSDNCFCFKNLGDHRKVPEILSQNNDNLERLVVYLYKDKSIDKVKMYIPNEEKQALIPDLAFEVGDKLVTVEDEKVKDVLSRVANMPISHEHHKHPHIDTNKVLSTEINIPANDIYVDDVTYHDQPQVDTHRVPSKLIYKPADDMYVDDVTYHDQPQVDTHRVPSKVIYKPADDMYVDDIIYHDQPHVHTHRVPSKVINKPADDMYVDDVTYHDQPHVHTHIVPSKVINKPADDMYVDDVTYHDQPHVHTHRVPSKVINKPADDMYVDDVTYYDQPQVHTHRVPSKVINKPADDMYVDDVTYDDQPQVDINRVPSKEINIPANDMYVDDITYHDQPQVDTHRVPSKVINIPADNMYVDDVTYHDLPQIDTNRLPSKEIIKPSENMFLDDGTFYAPSQVDINRIRPKEINIPAKLMYVDGNSYHVQHKPPITDNNEINIPEFQYVPIESYVHEQPQNIPADVMYLDNIISPPFSIGKGYPSISKDNAFVLDGQPGGDWNILPEYPYHGQRVKPHANTKVLSNEINVPAKVMYVDNENPKVSFNQGIPSINGEFGFVVNSQPGVSWNILPEYPMIDPHKHSKEHMFINSDIPTHYNGKHMYHEHSKPSANHLISEELELNEEIIPSAGIEPNVVASTEIESNLEVNPSIGEDISKTYDSKESRSKEDTQPIENESRDKNQSSEYSDPSKETMYSDEIDVVPKASEEDNSKSTQNNHNQYETFDIWFGQQMQRFKTYTEHDKAVNLATIERYILKILRDNGMHVTAEGVLTDSFGTALDVQNLNLRPILIGNPLAFGRMLNAKLTDFILPANMAYLQAILVTNAHPSMILGIIPIGKTVIPPSAINAYSTLLKPHVHSSSKPAKGYYTHLSLSKTASHKAADNSASINFKGSPGFAAKKPLVWHLANSKQMPVSTKNNVVQKQGKTVITVVKKTPVLVRHRHRQPAKSVQVYGTGSHEFSFQSDNSDEAVNKLIISMRAGNDPLLNSEDATNQLLAAIRGGNDSIMSTSEESVDSDEDDIDERIIGGSAATGSGTPLSVKGRIKDFYN